jgi:PIN domain nuclease of toxin-antitoxin system
MGSLETMRLLLDTHILLWSLLEPSKLTHQVALELENPSNELWLSPISTWELILLVEKGRVILETNPISWIRDVFRKIPFREAPVNHEVAIQSCVIELPHQDPADRFLVATALVYDLTLVTADDRLLAARGISALPNK